MERVLKETSKLITIMIVIVFFSLLLSEEPLEAKANRIIQNKLSLHENLTREERDEYMLYLRSLNAETNDFIFSLEVP